MSDVAQPSPAEVPEAGGPHRDPAGLQGMIDRDPHGRLVYTDGQGIVHIGVQAVRAFPIEAPLEGLSLVGADGHELEWIDHWGSLPEPARSLIESELGQREFMPTIQRLVAVSTFSTPSTWTVDTDRGRTQFILKGEEDIRRLQGGGLLVTDNHGLVFRVMDLKAMDRATRKLLDRFL